MAAAAVTKRRSASADGGGGIAALPEELLHEVFSRVGNVKALFLFAVTSRRWLRLFTDPAFLRGLCPGHGEGHRARLLGFVPRQAKLHVRSRCMMKMRMAQRTSVSPPTFLPAPGSPLGTGERALTSFAAADDGTFNYAQALAARRGVVLMQLVPRTFNRRTRPLLFGLWNPTTCERHVLPPLESPLSRESVDGYAIAMAADGDDLAATSPSGRFAFSQLLIIATQYEGNYRRYLHSYSAATGSWSAAPTACLDGCLFSLVGERPAAVHGGAAHWLCNSDRGASTRAPRVRDDHSLHKLSVELGTSTTRFSLTKLPVRAGGTPLLHVSRDGKLSIACVYLAHATVWTQQEEEEEDAWIRTRAFRIQIPLAVPARLQDCMGEWYELDEGSVLVLGREGGVFVLDLEKEVMEKVMDYFPWLRSDEHFQTHVPYELDLVDFFVSHLGGLLSRGG
jgi:hypothetical protein